MTPVARVLPAVTLLAVLTITASAEFELARAVLDLPPRIAWALPVAVDSYVLAALWSGRDVLGALLVMSGSLTASMGAHLAASAQQSAEEQLPAHVVAPAATAIMIVLVVVAWRVHVLIQPPPASAAANTTSTATVSAANGTARVAMAKDPRPSTPVSRAQARNAPVRGAIQSAGVVGLTDGQILAALDTSDVELPSIRSLMRTYGIGQSRATRIHAAASSRITPKTTRTQDQTTEDDEPSSTSETTNSHTTEASKNNDPENPIKNAQGAKSRNTHIGITDRAGRARSVLDARDHGSANRLHVVRDE